MVILCAIVALLVLGAVLYALPALAWAQRSWTADEAIAAFTGAGLEVSDLLPLDEDPHPELPPPVDKGLAFAVWDAVLCLCTGYGPGFQVMSLASRRQLEDAQTYYQEQLAIDGYQYVLSFSLDNLIVVAVPDIPPDLFEEYQAALQNARG